MRPRAEVARSTVKCVNGVWKPVEVHPSERMYVKVTKVPLNDSVTEIDISTVLWKAMMDNEFLTSTSSSPKEVVTNVIFPKEFGDECCWLEIKDSEALKAVKKLSGVLEMSGGPGPIKVEDVEWKEVPGVKDARPEEEIAVAPSSLASGIAVSRILHLTEVQEYQKGDEEQDFLDLEEDMQTAFSDLKEKDGMPKPVLRNCVAIKPSVMRQVPFNVGDVFLEFETGGDAKRAMEQMRGRKYDKKQLQIEFGDIEDWNRVRRVYKDRDLK